MSARSIECKLCGAHYKIQPSAQSRRLNCKKCGHSMFVAASRRARLTPGVTMAKGTPTRRKRSATPIIAVTVVLIVVASAMIFWH